MKKEYRFAVKDFNNPDCICRFMLLFFSSVSDVQFSYVYLIKMKSLTVAGKGLENFFTVYLLFA